MGGVAFSKLAVLGPDFDFNLLVGGVTPEATAFIQVQSGENNIEIGTITTTMKDDIIQFAVKLREKNGLEYSVEEIVQTLTQKIEDFNKAEAEKIRKVAKKIEISEKDFNLDNLNAANGKSIFSDYEELEAKLNEIVEEYKEYPIVGMYFVDKFIEDLKKSKKPDKDLLNQAYGNLWKFKLEACKTVKEISTWKSEYKNFKNKKQGYKFLHNLDDLAILKLQEMFEKELKEKTTIDQIQNLEATLDKGFTKHEKTMSLASSVMKAFNKRMELENLQKKEQEEESKH